MGLIRDALEAIVRIDRNIAEIRKVLMWDRDAKLFRATYMQKPIEPKGSTFDRVLTEKDFCYPDHLTLGGRLKAVRMFVGFNQTEIAEEIGISSAHVSKLESDLATPSAMLIRSVSTRFNIDETWLATGKLSQIAENEKRIDEINRTIGQITPLSGYEEGQ